MTIDLDALECRVDSCLGQTIIISTAKVHELIQRLREAERDAERWLFCLEHGFPVRNGSARTVEKLWGCNVIGVGRTGFGETAKEAVDAAIYQQRKIATGEDIGL